MGLDHGLNRTLYVKQWEHKGKDNYIVKVTGGGKGKAKVNSKKITHITEEVIVLRKANMIHKWFVDNVQGGEDNCEDHNVSVEQLIELRDLCGRVLATARLTQGKVHAGTRVTAAGTEELYEKGMVVQNAEALHALLPTSSGCFFGSTNYDEWYINDVRAMYDALCELNLDPDDYTWNYEYWSSW